MQQNCTGDLYFYKNQHLLSTLWDLFETNNARLISECPCDFCDLPVLSNKAGGGGKAGGAAFISTAQCSSSHLSPKRVGLFCSSCSSVCYCSPPCALASSHVLLSKSTLLLKILHPEFLTYKKRELVEALSPHFTDVEIKMHGESWVGDKVCIRRQRQKSR